jgi:hypothetical protein
LFGEAQGRILLTTREPAAVVSMATARGVSAHRIGTVRASRTGITIKVGTRTINAPLARLAAAYHEAIPSAMSTLAAPAAEPALIQH